MTIRQQIVEDHIEKTAKILGASEDNAFLIFSHSLFTDKSIHSFDPSDNVDGGQDKQIDAITVEEINDEAFIHVSQVKNEDNFSSNSVIQIRNGLEWLLLKKNSDVETLTNKKFKDKIKFVREIRSTLGSSNIHFVVRYICKGLSNKASEEVNQELKTILDSFDNDTYGSFKFELVGSDEIVSILNSQDKKNRKINCDIKIVYDTNNPSLIKYQSQGLKGVICTVRASEIATLVIKDPNGYIFDLNIRKYIGNRGGVNKDILSTCSNEVGSHLFWFLNNGITIVCDKVDPVQDPDNPVLKIENMQIVNGCQTSTSLALAMKSGDLLPETKVLLRVYETNDLELVDKIVLTTNNQNKISGRNLRANEKIQFDIEQGFKLYDYYLERKPRQYENAGILKDKIIPNEEVGIAFLAILLKKPSDARSRKYKVWEEYYDKIFNASNLIETYLLSVLIHRRVNYFLLNNYSNSDEDLTRYLARNASLHISRMSALIWRKSENWQDQNEIRQNLSGVMSDNSIIDTSINKAFNLLKTIIENNSKFKLDLNSTFKSSELDNEISKHTHNSIK